MASTAVASMQNIAAPDSASELIWVKCQSLAEPSIAEYWHIGATMMRLGNVRSRNWIGENRTLMLGIPAAEKAAAGYFSCGRSDYQLLASPNLPTLISTIR